MSLIRLAGAFVPQHLRKLWHEQWEAEFQHPWQRYAELDSAYRAAAGC